MPFVFRTGLSDLYLGPVFVFGSAFWFLRFLEVLNSFTFVYCEDIGK
jgi:hypothetical protein